MDGWMGRRVDGQVGGWAGRWIDGSMDQWVNGWMDMWMNRFSWNLLDCLLTRDETTHSLQDDKKKKSMSHSVPSNVSIQLLQRAPSKHSLVKDILMSPQKNLELKCIAGLHPKETIVEKATRWVLQERFSKQCLSFHLLPGHSQ
jgi:hypothetical protein